MYVEDPSTRRKRSFDLFVGSSSIFAIRDDACKRSSFLGVKELVRILKCAWRRIFFFRTTPPPHRLIIIECSHRILTKETETGDQSLLTLQDGDDRNLGGRGDDDHRRSCSEMHGGGRTISVFSFHSYFIIALGCEASL